MTTPGKLRVGAVVLAAGFSNRFGGIKLAALLPDGRTVIDHTLSALGTAIPDLLVVTRREAALRLPAHGGRVLNFNEAEQGMGASLAWGITQCGDWDACLVCLGDMPALRPATYAAIRDAVSIDTIVVPRYRGQAGNPCGFGRLFFDELRQLTGDRGGRAVISTHPEAVLHLDLDDPALLFDIDSPEDLARFEHHELP